MNKLSRSPVVLAVTARSVYGVERYYPNNDNAHTLARIAGTKTLTAANLKDAMGLGLHVRLLNAVVDGLGAEVRKLISEVQS